MRLRGPYVTYLITGIMAYVRPFVARASTLCTVGRTDGKPHVNVCEERRACSRRFLGIMWALGNPRVHVRDTYLTPNVIRFRMTGRTPGEVGRNPTVCEHVCSKQALPTLRGFSGTLSTLPSLVRIGLCAFSILGYARPNGIRVLYDWVLPGRYNVR